MPLPPLRRLARAASLWAVAMGLLVFTSGVVNATPVQWTVASGGNAHWYEYVPISLTWTEAQYAASQQVHASATGHLATILSAEEQSFVETLLATHTLVYGDIWLGGSDAAAEGEWKWITGPEASHVFWVGNQTGSSPNGSYAYWETVGGTNRQPDDAGGEDFLSIQFNPNPGNHISDEMYQWNDLPGSHGVQGYLVEYSAVPEPNTALLLALGLSALGMRRRHR